jgi:hypothetical protein
VGRLPVDRLAHSGLENDGAGKAADSEEIREQAIGARHEAGGRRPKAKDNR